MSHRDITEVEPDGSAQLSASNRAIFLEKVRQSNAACQNGDYSTAVALYTEALQLDPSNHILYSNRSAARLKQGLFAQALQDAVAARDLCPTWPKAYYRQGVALQCLGRHGEALASFSQGLAQDSTSQQLLGALVEASLKSPLRRSLEPIFEQLELMKLDRSPFVLISVVGQELLASGMYSAAVAVLESALRIGSCSLKLRGSVFSALSSAHWALNQLDKAISYMQQDLAVAKSLGDTSGECRAHGNLGSAYFSRGSYKEALTAHRYQLVLAMKCRDTRAAAAALTSLGHVYTSIGDYANALASHKQGVQLVKQIGDRLQEAREIGNVGAVYLATGDFDSAVDCHAQHLKLAKRLGDRVEEARAYSNLGSSHHYKRNFAQAIAYHEKVLRIAQAIGDKLVEARAHAGLGHAARCAGDYAQAKHWHERQLDVALATRDKVGEGRACSNLGIVYQLLGEFDAALKLHQAHLSIARSLQDRAGLGRAYGNIGNAYSAAGFYEQAIKYHKQELTISKEVHDRSSEASTHGNLAVAYQALGAHEMALLHYRAHLAIARELKDAAGEACALSNLANCLSSRGEFADAIPYYEQYLMLSQELGDVDGEAKACHFLGYAHYRIGNYREAVRYYDQDLALAKDAQDKANMGRAYCNLGLAHFALAQYAAALECQKYFLAIAHMTNNTAAKYRALGNIGDVLLKTNELDEAAKMYQRQLSLARAAGDKNLEAGACGALGAAHRLLSRLDKALGYHTQELTLRQEALDVRGECRAHGHLGLVHMALGNYTLAVKCYDEQLERARELRDCALEAHAHGALGVARLNQARYEDAIGHLEQQLAILERVATARLERARAYGALGDCYEALRDYDEALRCHGRHLAIAAREGSARDQERAYGALARAHRALGDAQQALVCLEKRLVVAHECGADEAKASAYGELGGAHAALGNLEQAVSCLEHQRDIARELGDRAMEAEAMSGLGCVYQRMGDYVTALRYHQGDLEISDCDESVTGQCRAYGNIGAVYESMGNLEQAVAYHERQLKAGGGDAAAKARAYGALGRVHRLLGDRSQAIAYLSQGLALAETLDRKDDEVAIRDALGSALWASGDADAARRHLEAAVALVEDARRRADAWPANAHRDTYDALQRILIELNRNDEALVLAEKTRNWAFSESFRDARLRAKIQKLDDTVSTWDQIRDTVDRQKSAVLYYSLAGGHLSAWLIVPNKGIVKFHTMALFDPDGPEGADGELGELIARARDSLGAGGDDSNAAGGQLSLIHEDDDAQFAPPHAPGFLRMNRQHLMNSSNYSLSSLFSVGSVGNGSVASLRGSTRSSVGSAASGSQRAAPGAKRLWKGPQCLHRLYEMLVEPFDEHFPKKGAESRSRPRELTLVPDGELSLVPFALLRSASDGAETLCERFALAVAPSVSSLRTSARNRRVANAARRQERGDDASVRSVVVGGDGDAEAVAELLRAPLVLGHDATKEQVVRKIEDAECVHFATALSWPRAALVLDQADKPGDEQQDVGAYSEFLLDAADILSMKLSARLVVLSPSRAERSSWATSDGLTTLVRSFLVGGAQAVLVSLWPVPDNASKILLRAFYSAMLQGTSAARALTDAQQTVQHTKHFAHPANWAGFALAGSNVRLSNKVALMGDALRELLAAPDRCRDALRVSLHLVEKTLQRIHRGQKNAMYTTHKSIENKVGAAGGWRELLMSVGFRFEPASNGIPSSVFFPQSDPDERLAACSASLQALLALQPASIQALSKLTATPEVADDVIAVVASALQQFKSDQEHTVEVLLNVRLWRVPGCHELLASLGFDLCDVGQDKVTLRTGKMANRRNVQFTHQALLALFDTQEAPKSLSLDSSSSLESLEDEYARSEDEAPPPVYRRSLAPPSGAFTSYVRRRGEPDGKTNEPAGSSVATDKKPTIPRPGGSLSDQAFTPSPPVASMQPDAQMSLSLAHQTRIRSLYADSKRPDSSSSASSDWDNGQNTVLRRQKYDFSSEESELEKIDRLSCRSEVAARLLAKNKKPITLPSEETLPSNERLLYFAPNEKKATREDKPMHESLLRHINRGEMTPTISEVYHERNIGLGLAPPLSKLLLAPENDDEQKPWMAESASSLSRIRSSDLTTADILERETKNKLRLDSKEFAEFTETARRDEGDGRSIADSSSSSYKFRNFNAPEKAKPKQRKVKLK